MSNHSFNFLFDVCLILMSLLYIFRMVHLRFTRKTTQKNESRAVDPSVPGWLLSTKVLILVIIVALLAIGKTVFDVHKAVAAHGSSVLGDLWVMLAFGATIFFVILYAIYNISRHSEPEQKDERE